MPDRVAEPGGLTVRGVLVGVAKPVLGGGMGGGGTPAGGLLDRSGGFVTQGPAATGAPTGAPAAPAAPPVIIR